MATRTELFAEVKRLNSKYCKNTKNKLVVDRAYGGYQVGLTGKRYKNNSHKWRGIGSGMASVTTSHQSATRTLNDLYASDSKGYLKSKIKHYEKYRSR